MKIFNGKRKKEEGEIAKQPDSLEAKAIDILKKITKEQKNPNKFVIDELVKLVVETANQEDPDLKQVLHIAKTLFAELLKGIKQPNVELVDQYISLLVMPAQKKKALENESIQKAPEPVLEQKTANQKLDLKVEQSPPQESYKLNTEEEKPDQPKPEQTPIEKSENHKDYPNNITESKFEVKDPETHSEKISSAIEKTSTAKPTREQEAMMGLMMDEIKELMSVATKNSEAMKEQEKKLTTSMEFIKKDQKTLRANLDEIKDKFQRVESSIEKFIGLYEVVTNIYNPFMEKNADNNMPQKKESEEMEGNFFDNQIDSQKKS